MISATTLPEAALEYARLGFYVFPLSPGTKIPFEHTNGFLDATRDEAQIIKWWRDHPTANIGIATGRDSGVMVIDIDRDPTKGKHGDDDMDDLVHTLGALPDTPTVMTPSGGEHRYFRMPSRPVTVRKIGHIDVCHDGHYVVAPPSVTKAGAYVWELT